MDTVKFKKTLFGFKRRQVIDYIAETEAGFETEKRRLEIELGEIKHENEIIGYKLTAAEKAAEDAVGKYEAAVRDALSAREDAVRAAAQRNELSEKYQSVRFELDSMRAAQEQKDSELASLREETSKLSEYGRMLSGKLSEMSEQLQLNERAYQKSRRLLTDYLDVLHRENIALAEENAGRQGFGTVRESASAEEIVASIKTGIDSIIKEQNDRENHSGNLKAL